MSEKLTCLECGADNPENSKFCGLCGNELKSIQVNGLREISKGTCKSCGIDLPENAKFCHSCGISVAGEHQSQQKLKQINSKPVEKIISYGSIVPVLLTVLLFIAAGFVLSGLAANEFDAFESSKDVSGEPSSETQNQHNHPTMTADAETLAKIETLKNGISSSTDAASKQKFSSELAEIYMKLGRMVDAADILIGFLPYDPKNEQVLVTIANLLDDGGEKQKAIEYYKKVLDLNPKNVDARVDMATIMISSESPMMAIAELKKALEIKPDHQIANLNMGIMSYTVGKYDKALEWFQIARNIDPNSSAGKKAAEGITAIESINNKSKTK